LTKESENEQGPDLSAEDPASEPIGTSADELDSGELELVETVEPVEDEDSAPAGLPEPTQPEPVGLTEAGLDATDQISEAPSPLSAEAEAELLRKTIAEKDSQLSQVMTAYRSLKKETEKLRKRMENQQRRRLEQSKGDFIAQFVEVLDNLDRAIESIESNFDSDSVLEGIILVRSRMVQLLREEGLEKIFVGGQPFDPTHSEAAGIEPVEDESQDNVVLKELQRGYMLKGGLLRPARVVVGRYTRTGEEKPLDATPSAEPATQEEQDDLE
jgi:molecular chaperone GrpE